MFNEGLRRTIISSTATSKLQWCYKIRIVLDYIIPELPSECQNISRDKLWVNSMVDIGWLIATFRGEGTKLTLYSLEITGTFSFVPLSVSTIRCEISLTGFADVSRRSARSRWFRALVKSPLLSRGVKNSFAILPFRIFPWSLLSVRAVACSRQILVANASVRRVRPFL